MSRIRRESALLTVASMSRCRFLFVVLEVRMWRLNARLRFTTPLADTRNRLAADFLVFIFGIEPLLCSAARGGGLVRRAARRGGRRPLTGPFLRRQDHVEKRPFLARLGLDHAVFGDFTLEPAENPVPDVPVHVIAAAEDHGGLHLLPLGEESDDVVALEFVVVLVGLGAELHLLDLDDFLLLLRLLGLLVELVAVLAVVQDAADGWYGVGRNLHQIQPALLRRAQGLLGRHDPEL